QRGFALKAIAGPVRRIGQAEAAAAVGLELLHGADLPLMPLEDLVEGLETLQGEGLAPAVGERLWAAIRAADPGEVDEFVAPPIAAVVARSRASAAGLVDPLARALA